MKHVIKSVYDELIRPALPRKIGVFRGVAVRDPRLLDAKDVDTDYKKAFVDAVAASVEEGDSVGVVGAGHGVSAVVAARAAGESGHITVFEAGKQWAERLPETLEINAIPSDRVTIRHALVGDAVDVHGELDGAEEVPVSALADFDVLDMDCEGAEVSILQSLPADGPRTVVTETHPSDGAETAEVIELLAERGYECSVEGSDRDEGDIVVGVK